MKLLCGFLFLALAGCSMSSEKPTKPALLIDGSPAVKFSEYQQMPVTPQRSFKRMTKQKLEEESEVQAQAGSLWVMEGQGSYLFSQNKARREGDLLNVRMEGAAQKQVETKVSVIKKLLKQLEEEEKLKRQKSEEELNKKPEDKGTLAQTDGAAAAARAPASETAPPAVPGAPAEKEEALDLQTVQTKITEKQSDGFYRIKGQQPFMIGKREYKVIVTGLIRSEDFNDEGVSSNKVVDAQYDVVSLRRKNSQEM